MNQAFVYIMVNRNRTIYVGVTSNLERRVWEHRTHRRDGFTKRYDLTKLVYIAEFARMDDAIAWEKSLKGKARAKKIALIEERNPRWNDLAWNWYEGEVGTARRANVLRTGILRSAQDDDDVGDASTTILPRRQTF